MKKEVKEKGLTEIVYILDRSGSMGGLEADTIGGFNSMIEKQKKENGDVFVTTVLFDNRCQTAVYAYSVAAHYNRILLACII